MDRGAEAPVILYWDSSAFLTLYTEQAASSEARRLFAESRVNLVSKLTLLETCRGLFSMAARGKITRVDCDAALRRLRGDREHLSARSVDGLLAGPAFERYLGLLARHEHLGTNDVLHLTSALVWKTDLKQPITMATRDRALAAAARHERLAVVIPGG
ncbi:MAG: PIN domain-containing protein [Planctomycetes bacterium]|nr:PIN domain-containing protein [Planctomycetota bacterium]